jgi:hypothetical protein
MNETEINIICPRCGAKVYYELNQCPQCGLDFYPEQEEIISDKEDYSPAWLHSLKGIIPGWMVAGIIVFLFHYLLAQFFTPNSLNLTGSIILFLAGPLGAFAGGYTVSAIVRRQEIIHALAIFLSTVIVVILLDTHWWDVSVSFLLLPLSVINWLVILVSAIGGALFYPALQRGGIKWPHWSNGEDKRLYQDLVIKARYDHDRVERLIEYERRRTPSASRKELIKSAIDRWERDNR